MDLDPLFLTNKSRHCRQKRLLGLCQLYTVQSNASVIWVSSVYYYYQDSCAFLTVWNLANTAVAAQKGMNPNILTYMCWLHKGTNQQSREMLFGKPSSTQVIQHLHHGWGELDLFHLEMYDIPEQAPKSPVEFGGLFEHAALYIYMTYLMCISSMLGNGEKKISPKKNCHRLKAQKHGILPKSAHDKQKIYQEWVGKDIQEKNEKEKSLWQRRIYLNR